MKDSVVSGARSVAKRSRYDQMVWHDGCRREGRVTAENVKAALLACGTAGAFIVYSARTGTPHQIRWRTGLAYLGNLRAGWYSHG